MKFTFKENYVDATLGHGKLVISGDSTIGFRPVELLVSSVASCSGNVFKKILEKQRTEFSRFTVEAAVERNEEEANRVEKIMLHFIIEGKDLNEKKLTRNLSISRKHCGMYRSVENSIEVEDKLTVINK